ncbi:MAG: agmatine deiminase family protein [Chloroflexota bacterium]|nr:MAG: agmatine deiminase family protein [Chloroflexota bacterium]
MNFRPADPGYHMPAEWEPHEGAWLQWPQDRVEPGYEMKQEYTWLKMVAALFQHENVHIVVGNERQRDHVARQLDYFGIGHHRVDLFVIPFNDIWARDNGPIYVIGDKGDLTITNWRFNGWGDRFEYDLDDQVPAKIGQMLDIPVVDAPLVLEGGAVEVNGRGAFMATRSSIFDPFRNPGRSQAQIEAILEQYLGVNHFIWLTGAGRGECEKWGDTTDSHIDIVARFTNESTILYNCTDDRADPRYPMFARHLEELKAATTEDGRPFTLVPLPVPKNGVHQVASDSQWRSSRYTDATYSNYLVANGVVLMPVFGNVYDERAKRIIAEQFPGREVVAIDAVSLTEDGGAIHCVTQQQPLCEPRGGGAKGQRSKGTGEDTFPSVAVEALQRSQ